MMTAYAASVLVDAMATQARIEGMKAENASRESRGLSVAYGEDSFDAEANTLAHLAGVLRSL